MSKIGKIKHHKRGFSEDVADKRNARINFKRYLQELEDQESLEEMQDEIFENLKDTEDK